MNILLKETDYFFEHILHSESLQLEYDLLSYSNSRTVLNIIKEFKEQPSTFFIKPFYENNYLDADVPRSFIIQRDSSGLITMTDIKNKEYTQAIEPLRFVSLIKELIEDELIKKEMHVEKNVIKENTAHVER